MAIGTLVTDSLASVTAVRTATAYRESGTEEKRNERRRKVKPGGTGCAGRSLVDGRMGWVVARKGLRALFLLSLSSDELPVVAVAATVSSRTAPGELPFPATRNNRARRVSLLFV